MNEQEELVIRKAQRGNIFAFETLVHQYDEQVMKIILNLVNDIEDAKDIYQEVFIKVFRSISKFKFQSKFSTWLFKIAVNTCINFRKKRVKHRFDSLDEEYENTNRLTTISLTNNAKDPEQQLLDSELSRQIQLCINQLSPKQRAVFVLRHYQGHKISEIAEILNCAEGTVKNYMFRSMQKMRKFMQSYQ